jgi:hypothetical protein
MFSMAMKSDRKSHADPSHIDAPLIHAADLEKPMTSANHRNQDARYFRPRREAIYLRTHSAHHPTLLCTFRTRLGYGCIALIAC